jgi:hypothetical protein
MPSKLIRQHRVRLLLRSGHRLQADEKRSEAEPLTLSERDSLRVHQLIENPPAAPERLLRVARNGFTHR